VALTSTGSAGLDLVRSDLKPQGKAATGLRKLVLQLDAPTFRERREAGRQLMARGPSLSRFIEDERQRHLNVPEIKIRTRELLAHWNEQKVTLANPEVRARVMKYLAVMGADELRADLQGLKPKE